MAVRKASGTVLITGVLVLSVAAPEALVSQSQTPGTGSIAGDVVIAGTNRPALDTVVELTGGQTSMAVLTDEQGAFVFKGLRPGFYNLSASKERYLKVTYGQIRPGSASLGVPIRLGDGERVEKLRLVLPLASVITGHVMDRNGEPMQGVAMSAIRFSWRTGERSISVVSTTTTDDRGEYRLSPLLPGEYLVSARPRSRPTDGIPAAIYYPTAVSAALGAPLTLGISEERPAVDFQLSRISLARIRGRAIGIDGRPVTNVPIEAADVAPAITLGSASSYAGEDGRFALPGLAPGRYRLIGYSELGSWAAMDVSLGDRDLEDVQLRFQPTMNASGRVVLDDGRTPVAGVTVQLHQPNGAAGASRMPPPYAKTDANGAFTMPRVHDGPARVYLDQIPQDLAVKSVQVAARDAFDQAFDIAPGEELKDILITLTKRKASLVGTLLDARNTPTADYLVVVFSAEERYWFFGSRRIATTRPSTDGRFLFDGLPPGSYRVAALTDAEEGQWFDPAFLRNLFDASAPVTIREGEQSRQDLRLK